MAASQPRVVILTPVKNAVAHLDRYFELLERLKYPHELLSLGMLESDSSDDTLATIKTHFTALRGFAQARVWKRDYGFQIPKGKPRWEYSLQPVRREILARSRNYLLSQSLGDAAWVLWLDVDLIEYPPDIIERLLGFGKDILHPNCVKQPGGKSYDWNAWAGEGRLLMSDLRGRGELVEIESVGGTMLFIRADLHREGLVFPPFYLGRMHERARRRRRLLPKWAIPILQFLVPGEIETEGLAMMAHEMGIPCWGLPELEIVHKDA
jgi:glycosyltransferase involved in cell wall biosynthesis